MATAKEKFTYALIGALSASGGILGSDNLTDKSETTLHCIVVEESTLGTKEIETLNKDVVGQEWQQLQIIADDKSGTMRIIDKKGQASQVLLGTKEIAKLNTFIGKEGWGQLQIITDGKAGVQRLAFNKDFMSAAQVPAGATCSKPKAKGGK